jgi:putative hydrolase of the HAD superfamily
MKAVLFDLDDTLYPEIEFVKSGFSSVARYLSLRYHIDKYTLFNQMLDLLQRDGRGKVFDTLLRNLNLYTEEKVRLLVYLYRSHRPTIHLYEDALPTLEHLIHHNICLGIVTDGMASVQRNKIAALKLESLFDVIVCTDELGREYWKPSTTPYNIALDFLEVTPLETAYVGNDPSKDFLGANILGMSTIQVRRSEQRNCESDEIPESAAAKVVIKGLKAILPIVGEKFDV